MSDKPVTKEEMIITINNIVDSTRRRNLAEHELSECVYYLALTIKYILDQSTELDTMVSKLNGIGNISPVSVEELSIALQKTTKE